MITITSKKDFRAGYKIEGHAGFAEHGQDIVCASVSAITQTALLGLLRYGDVAYQMSNGFLDVDIHTRNAQTDAIVESMKIGLAQVATLHPERVYIKEKSGVIYSG